MDAKEKANSGEKMILPRDTDSLKKPAPTERNKDKETQETQNKDSVIAEL
ncbi:hypothetical protein [Rubrolithibacter danxiaensis]